MWKTRPIWPAQAALAADWPMPKKTHQRMAYKLALLTATVASSFLARFQLTHLVTVFTAFSSMIISYSEFADADRKVER